MAESQNISISGNENIIAIGTVTINIGQTPGETGKNINTLYIVCALCNSYESYFSFMKVSYEISALYHAHASLEYIKACVRVVYKDLG